MDVCEGVTTRPRIGGEVATQYGGRHGGDHLGNGTEVVARLENGRLVLEPSQALLERLQDRYADLAGSLADELIDERRESP